MDVHFTARRYEVAPELREYISKKLEKLEQFHDGIREARVILTAENYRQIADVTLLARGREFAGREESADMYSSVDQVVEKLAKQIRRSKDKRISRGRRDGRASERANESLSEVEIPVISRRDTFAPPETLTVDEALVLLDDRGGEVIVFENAETSKTTVIYRRDDGSYGLIEPTD
jgi:putative sigma-54 modulation protein